MQPEERRVRKWIFSVSTNDNDGPRKKLHDATNWSVRVGNKNIQDHVTECAWNPQNDLQTFFICLLPAISKCTLWLAILPIELDAKHWYSPTSVLFFARLWITLVIINAPLDAILLLESATTFCPSFSHVILEGGGEPFTRQFNVTGSFLRATVFVGSWLNPRGTKGPEKAPGIMFSTKLVRV